MKVTRIEIKDIRPPRDLVDALAHLAAADNSKWYWQFIIFALLSVTLTLIYWKKLRKFNHKTEQPLLNSGTERLIGGAFHSLRHCKAAREKYRLAMPYGLYPAMKI